MNITKEEIKSIAVTSAIAGAGAAVASAIVGYLLEHYVFQNETSGGPTFVILPVQQAPTGVSGFGALSQEQRMQIQALVPWRYWDEFERCWSDAPGADPSYCRELNKIYEQLDSEDEEEMDEIVTSVPNVGKTEYLTHLFAAGVAGVVGGVWLSRRGR